MYPVISCEVYPFIPAIVPAIPCHPTRKNPTVRVRGFTMDNQVFGRQKQGFRWVMGLVGSMMYRFTLRLWQVLTGLHIRDPDLW
jgi:hypothetical protein